MCTQVHARGAVYVYTLITLVDGGSTPGAMLMAPSIGSAAVGASSSNDCTRARNGRRGKPGRRRALPVALAPAAPAPAPGVGRAIAIAIVITCVWCGWVMGF
jgi:hypothetical protein